VPKSTSGAFEMRQKHRVLIWETGIQKRDSNQESKKSGKREEQDVFFPLFLLS
jgi:hypothetical protein